jgi:phage gpG-like protein
MPGMKDNTAQIQQQLDRAMKIALLAIRTDAVGMVRDTMDYAYPKPIYYNGDLWLDISAEINSEGNGIVVGTNMEYAPYVHDGHAGHAVFFPNIGDKGEFRVMPGGYTPGRPFLTDTFKNSENAQRLVDIVDDQIKQNMD